MTKSLGPFDFGKEPQPAAGQGKRRRSLMSLGIDAFFPIVIVVMAYVVGRRYFGF